MNYSWDHHVQCLLIIVLSQRNVSAKCCASIKWILLCSVLHLAHEWTCIYIICRGVDTPLLSTAREDEYSCRVTNDDLNIHIVYSFIVEIKVLRSLNLEVLSLSVKRNHCGCHRSIIYYTYILLGMIRFRRMSWLYTDYYVVRL